MKPAILNVKLTVAHIKKKKQETNKNEISFKRRLLLYFQLKFMIVYFKRSFTFFIDLHKTIEPT